MKKQLILLAMILLPTMASADAAIIDGIYYKLNAVKGTAEVTSSPSKYSGDIVIPEKVTYEDVEYSVMSIGIGAFENCISLTSVVIPTSVNHIQSNAFMNCSELLTLELPSSLQTIGYQALCMCSSLTAIIIPASVTTIGNLLLSGCKNLASIVVDADNANYDSRGNCNAIINTTTGEMIAACKNTTIPKGIKKIGDSMFSGRTDLTNVILPEGLEQLGDWVFSGCTNLEKLSFPSTMQSYGRYTISGVATLREIKLYNPVPPTDNFDQFFNYVSENFDIYKFTWYVPKGSREAYLNSIPWWSGKEDGIVEFELEKCATPTIAMKDGKLTFSCETEGVKFNYDIQAMGNTSGEGNELQITPSYTVKVYASKDGYDDSDVATETINITRGDVNYDGEVTAQDASLILQYVAGKITW